MSSVLLVEVTGLHEKVERPLAPGGLNARDPLHLGGGLEVLEIMGLIDKQVVHPELVEDEAIVLLVLGEELLQPLLTPRLLLLDGLDDVPVLAGLVGPGGVFQEFVVLGDLLAEEPLLKGA